MLNTVWETPQQSLKRSKALHQILLLKYSEYTCFLNAPIWREGETNKSIFFLEIQKCNIITAYKSIFHRFQLPKLYNLDFDSDGKLPAKQARESIGYLPVIKKSFENESSVPII